MEFVYLFFVIVCVSIIIVFLPRAKKDSYSQDSIEILINYFGDKDFSQNKTIFELEEKLEINLEYSALQNKSIKKIIDDAKHKSDILYKHKMAINKSYTDLTTFKVIANCVIDYSAKKDMSIDDSIKILFLTIQKPYCQEIFDLDKNELKLINIFYDLIVGFVERYKKAIN